MRAQDEDFVVSIRDAVIAGHDDPAAETMRHVNLARDYIVRLLNETIAGCEGQDIRNASGRPGEAASGQADQAPRQASGLVRFVNDAPLAEDLLSEVLLDLWPGRPVRRALERLEMDLSIARYKALAASRRLTHAEPHSAAMGGKQHGAFGYSVSTAARAPCAAFVS